jgi:hypothetical protein
MAWPPPRPPAGNPDVASSRILTFVLAVIEHAG